MTDEKNKKLGRGLSSLLSGKSFSTNKVTSFVDSLNTELKIGITKITPNPTQPRKDFSKEELQNLASSIKEKGVIQPILVRKDKNDDGYEIVAGERRWRAAQIAGLHEIPSIVKKLSDQEVIEIALVENIQRENLNPVEEAQGYALLVKNYNYKQEQLAHTVGKSRSHITNMIRLLDLPPAVLQYLINGNLTVGQARPLIGRDNAEDLAKIIIKKKLTARQSEKLIANLRTNNKPPKLVDPNIQDLENELSEKIGLRTSIKFSDKSTEGSITVYYSNLEQLDDIMRRLKLNR